MTKHDASHGGKKRNTGRTELLRRLASDVGTTLSNSYNILHDASITILDSQLCTKHELSASAAMAKRSKRNKPSNISKLNKALPFIQLVIDEVKCNKLCSIDETIHDLVLNRPDEIKGLTTVCTKTFYNYIHKGYLDLKPIDLPRMLRRKKSINYKTYIPKRHKGTPISERPFDMDDRSEFGHWEGDLVTGPRDGQHGAYLTLLEHKTRFYYMIPIKRKSAKQVYMKINELEKYYGQYFSEIFKSITFDNGNEFSRHKDIEKKCGTNKQRTKVYFGRPYHSCDRASNENCNGLIRYFIPKGTDINSIPSSQTTYINKAINNKKRFYKFWCWWKPTPFFLEHKKRDIGKNFRYNKITTNYRKEISLCPLLILSYLLSI